MKKLGYVVYVDSAPTHGRTWSIDAASLLADRQMKVKFLRTMLLQDASWLAGWLGGCLVSVLVSRERLRSGSEEWEEQISMTLSATMLQDLPEWWWHPSTNRLTQPVTLSWYVCHSKCGVCRSQPFPATHYYFARQQRCPVGNRDDVYLMQKCLFCTVCMSACLSHPRNNSLHSKLTALISSIPSIQY